MVSERLPPQSQEAEQAVLGACLISAKAVEIARRLVPEREVFYLEAHRCIWDAVASLGAAGDPVDLVTLCQRLQEFGTLDGSGGIAYLGVLLDSVPTAAHVEHYLGILLERWTLRRVQNGAADLIQMAYEAEDPAPVIQAVQRFALGFRRPGAAERSFTSQALAFRYGDRLLSSLDGEGATAGQVQFTRTGFARVDRLLGGGIAEGLVVVLASRTGMGKTAFAGQVCVQAAALGVATAYFSTEMHPDLLFERWLATEARVDYERVRHPEVLSETEASRLMATAGRLGDLAITAYNAVGWGAADIQTECRLLQRGEVRLGLVVVDYLQQLHSPRMGNREQEVAALSRAMKRMAMELETAFIVVSQISRQTEQRGKAERRPRLSDLRESGAIENDADVVLFPYRPDYYEEEHRESRGEGARPPDEDRIEEAELICAKNRFGPRGVIPLLFRRRHAAFAEVDLHHEPPPEP